MSRSATRLMASTQAYQAAAAMLFLATATLLLAWGFEIIGGYIPCPLCLQQRWAYYLAIPLLFAGLVLLSGGQEQWAALAFLAVAIAFLANAGLGVYQAGAEWKLWPGPSTCGVVQPLSGSAGDLLKNIEAAPMVRCDEASWRFLGLSFAGWNVVASLVIFAGCMKAAAETHARLR